MKNNQIRFGFIRWFDENKNCGRIVVAGEPQEVQFSLDSQKMAEPSENGPKFADHAPAETIMPQQMAQVVISLHARYDLEVQEDRRTLRRMVSAEAWDFVVEYKARAARVVFKKPETVVRVKNPVEPVAAAIPSLLDGFLPRLEMESERSYKFRFNRWQREHGGRELVAA